MALVPAGLQPDIAARVTGLSLPTLAKAFAELQAAQLVEGRQLAHDLVRETVLAELPGAALQLLHLTLARALAGDGHTPPMRMAEHWLGAQAWPEAALALREAAQQARQAGRLEETEALLQRVADAAALRAATTRRVSTRCAMPCQPACSGKVCGPCCRSWTHCSRRPVGAAHALNALRCEALLNLGQVDDALVVGAAALDEAMPGTRAQFEAEVLHGRALALSGRAADAVVALQAACDSADRPPDQADPQRAAGACCAGHALYIDNRHAQALQAQAQAVAMATRMADVTEQAHLNANLGVIAAHAGETLLALGAAEHAHRAFATMGLRSTHSHTNAVNLARLAAYRGRFDLSLQALQTVLNDDPAHNGPSVRALALAAHTSLRLTLVDEGPLAAAKQALQVLPLDDLLPQVQAMVLLVRLRLAVHQQGPTAALQGRLLKLGETAAALRDVPLLYREWATWERDPRQALQQLLLLEQRCRVSGAHGAARSLLLAALLLARQTVPARAQRWARRCAAN
jgi:tetratricopeptide (TPR) repeat protein